MKLVIVPKKTSNLTTNLFSTLSVKNVFFGFFQEVSDEMADSRMKLILISKQPYEHGSQIQGIEMATEKQGLKPQQEKDHSKMKLQQGKDHSIMAM